MFFKVTNDTLTNLDKRIKKCEQQLNITQDFLDNYKEDDSLSGIKKIERFSALISTKKLLTNELIKLQYEKINILESMLTVASPEISTAIDLCRLSSNN